MRWTLPATFLAATLAALGLAQTKPTLKPDDYKQWEALSNASISNDGHWINYTISQPDGNGRLVIKNSDGPESATVVNGAAPQFSDDSKWCAYLILPPKAVADKLREEKKPVENRLGLRNLAGGQERVIDRVVSFRFLKGSRYMVVQRYRGTSKPEGGSDMMLVDLSDGSSLVVGNVVGFSENHDSTLLALRIESDSGEGGIQILNPATRSLTPLTWGKEKTANLDWAKDKDMLVFLAGAEDDKHEGLAFKVFVAKDLREPKPAIRVFDPATIKDFPEENRIAEVSPTMINDDGTAVAFGVQMWRPKKKPPVKPEDRVNVEVWNTHDLRVMPRQKVVAGADLNRTDLCVWHLDDNSFRKIDDGDLQSAVLMPDFHHAVVGDAKPYASPVTNGVNYEDEWLVNTRTGEKTRLLTKVQWGVVPSRTGRYLAYFDRKAWWLYDINADKRRSLTETAKVPFEATEDDHTVPEKPPAGFPIFLKNDEGVLLPDEYDVWLARTGTPNVTRLTDGRKERVVYRYLDIDPSDDEDGPSVVKPFYFQTLDRDTKAAGFYMSDAAGKGKALLQQNARVGSLEKSKDTDRVLFIMGTFTDSPNLYLTNTAFTAIKPESKTNPQQEKYAWGKNELISYKSRFGTPLQGILTYPAGYEAGKTYPMVTYIYERLSDNLHGYSLPIEWSPYSVQILSQNGYFVFQPDIAYQPRNPGKSAVDCLEPAVQAVLDKHVGVDPAKVGLIGHSWGAYQTAFVTSVSKMFAVGVAGAPLTELTSMYNSFYWNSGVSNQQIFETSQARMEVPFWEDPKAYLDNSPVWQSQKRTAPILIAAGDADGAVDWHQAQYLYQTLRRMGKNAVLLVYAGENHNFTRRPDQLDYSRRLRHFLDVYLKGAKPEPWVTDGVPFLKKDD